MENGENNKIYTLNQVNKPISPTDKKLNKKANIVPLDVLQKKKTNK